MLSRLIREPLLHFIVITGLFFAAYNALNPVTDDNVIEVSEGRVQQLKNHFYRTWKRQPSADELAGLIDNFVLDEIYVREARALGLDENDEIIRRRLRQKMEFLQVDAAALEAPDDEVLQAFMQSEAERFKAPNRYSLQQVFVSTDRPAEDVRTTLEVQAQRIARGDAPQGDNSLLLERFDDVPAFELDRTFGDGFAARLESLPLNQWSGPVKSGLGLHFVYLHAYEAGQLPSLEAVRDKVLTEWQYRQQQSVKRQYERELRKQYRIQLPEQQASSGTGQ